MQRLRDRPTGDILVLMITFTICAWVAVVGTVLVIHSFTDPRFTPDLVEVGRNLGDIVNTLIGLLAGFLAGRVNRKDNDLFETLPPTPPPPRRRKPT
jgi:hypothetical protein